MEFENIRSAMDSEAQKAGANTDITIDKNSRMPLDRIRKKMRGEIIAQLAIIVLFVFAAFFIPMEKISRSVYIIFMTVTCLMTLGYLIRMGQFMKKSSQMAGSTKKVLHSILAELNATIEVYKASIIAGSLLLPISTAAILLGSAGKDQTFEKWFLFEISNSEMAIAVAVYLIIALAIIWSTGKWADYMYGKDKKHLEEQLAELSSEETL